MNEPAYPFRVRTDGLLFSFYSVSEEKIVPKLVVYTPVDDLIYNLALVDVMPDGSLADNVTTNNQDMNRVMATVIQTMLAFFEKYPDRLVYFQGSDDIRTRFYRILITRELEAARQLFVIYGKTAEQEYELFQIGQPYVGFLMQNILDFYEDD